MTVNSIPLVESNSIIDVACYGENTGSFVAVGSNQFGANSAVPYEYSLDGGNFTTPSLFDGLYAGTYTLVAMDANSCQSESVEVIISEPASPLGVSGNIIVDNLCYGNQLGSFIAVGDGGTMPYQYSIDGNNFVNDPNFSNLAAGDYTINIVDDNGCSAVSNIISINQPTQLSIAAISIVDVNCYGDYSGSFVADANGGLAPYTYSVGGSYQSDVNFVGLAAGNYTLTVMDVNSCTMSTAQFTISQPTLPLNAVIQKQSYNGYDISCFDGNDGEITVVATEGTTSYSYLWNDNSTTDLISGLSAGTYSVTVTDANGCETTASVSLNNPPALSVQLFDNGGHIAYSVSCFGASDGAIEMSVSGGTIGNYTFDWNNGQFATEDLTNIPVGTYNVVVTDDNLCSANASIVLDQPDELVVSEIIATDISCYGLANGEISITLSGGTPNYSFNWDSSHTTEDLTGLDVGTYICNILDANSCPVSTQAVIAQPDQITISGIVSENNGFNVSCNGGTDGMIDVSVTGGNSNAYEYFWTGPQGFVFANTIEDPTNLIAGNYSLSVTDDNNCQSIAISSEGVEYSWNNPVGLSSNHTVLVESNLNISIDGNSINIGDSIGVFYDSLGNEACAGFIVWNGANQTLAAWGTDGNYEGFTSGEEFSWKISQNGVVYNAVATYQVGGFPNQGTYSDNGISGLASLTSVSVSGVSPILEFELNEPTLLTLQIFANEVSCSGGSDGYIASLVNGGVSPYTYIWNNGIDSLLNENLTSGLYAITVTDANVCVINDDVTLVDPPLLTATISSPDIGGGYNLNCNGDNNASIDLDVSGGTLPYTYLWNTGVLTEDLSGLSAGDYYVTITDDKGCTFETNISVMEPDLLTVSANISQYSGNFNISCNGELDGSIDLTVSGGYNPNGYTYFWNNFTFSEDLSDLGAGTYAVSVYDNFGCFVNTSYTLTEPDSFEVSSTLSEVNGFNISCFNANDGIIDLTVSGGDAGSYGYVWTGPQGFSFTDPTAQDQAGLIAGDYSVAINDANGCMNITGTIVENITYYWPVSFNTSNNHTILVDANTIITIDGSPINIGDKVGVFYDSLGYDACGGYIIWDGSTQAITAWGTDGNNEGFAAGEAFSWKIEHAGNTVDAIAVYGITFPNQATYMANGLSGLENLVGESASSSSQLLSFTLTQPPQILLDVFAGEIGCFGGNDGYAIASVNGGMAPYTYLWDNGDDSTYIDN